MLKDIGKAVNWHIFFSSSSLAQTPLRNVPSFSANHQMKWSAKMYWLQSALVDHSIKMSCESWVYVPLVSQQGRGNSSLNSWFIVHLGRIDLRKEDDTVFGHASRIVSKNLANKLLHGGFIISFMKFIIILIFIMTDLSASNDVIVIIIIIIIFSRLHWGNKLKFSSFSNSFLDLFTSYQFLLYRQIIDLSSWSDTAGLQSITHLATHADWLLI